MKTIDSRPIIRSDWPKALAAAPVMGAKVIQRTWVMAANKTKTRSTTQRYP
jgi:hypothetical protein